MVRVRFIGYRRGLPDTTRLSLTPAPTGGNDSCMMMFATPLVRPSTVIRSSIVVGCRRPTGAVRVVVALTMTQPLSGYNCYQM